MCQLASFHYGTLLICPVQKQTFICTRLGKVEWREMELKRQHKREEADKEENTEREATGNKRKEGRTQVAVAVEIPSRREVSMRPATRDGENQPENEGLRGENSSRGPGSITVRHHQNDSHRTLP